MDASDAILALYCVLPVAALLGGEIYYRFLVDSTDGFDLDLVTHRWLQRHYRFNNFDVRDDVDYADRIAPGRMRVTVLGDSYSNGHGLEDVSQRLDNVLRGLSRTRIAPTAASAAIARRTRRGRGRDLLRGDVSLLRD
jgi:hypothetical protein